MIYVPEIDELTQARHLSEAEDMARSFIAVSTETPIADVGVRVVKKYCTPGQRPGQHSNTDAYGR